MNRKRASFKPGYLIIAVLAFAGFWLLRVGTNSEEFAAGAQIAALVAGLVLFTLAAIVLYRDDRAASATDDIVVGQPALARFLFASARSAPLWLGARLYLGYEWFEAGRHKLGNDAWTNGGMALRVYWERAVVIPEQGSAPITYGFYREYIQYMLDHEWYEWFAKIIVYGELLIGIGLIVGGLTGIAAFFGAFLNMSFMLAGTTSTNPVLFALSILIVLAWRVAGLIGVDRWLLPMLGVPWMRDRDLRRPAHDQAASVDRLA